MHEPPAAATKGRPAVRWPSVVVAAAVALALGFFWGRDLELQARIPQEWSFAPLLLWALMGLGGIIALTGLLWGLYARMGTSALVLLAVGLGLAGGAFLGQALA